MRAGQDADAVDDSARVTHTVSGGGYGSVSASPVTVTVTDDDTAGVTVSESTLTITEGGSGSYTVVLNTQPSGNVTITPSSNNTDVALSPTPLTFTSSNWDTAKTVTVRAGQDADAVDDSARVTHTVSGGGYGSVSASPVTVTVTDDDTAGVTVSKTALTITKGGSGSYTVKLNTQPSGNVTITPSSNNTDVTVSPTSLIFTSSDWDTAQTVTVRAGQDADAANDSARVTHTVSGGGYGSVSASPVTVTVTDDDTAGVTVSESTLTITEGGSGSYTVVLNTQPSGDVTITPSSNNTDVMLSPTTLAFTSSDWDTAQTVTVRAGQDPDTANDGARVTHTVSGGDYDTVTAESVAVTVTDDDTAGVTVSETGLTITEGGSGSYTVKLNTQPSGDVTITPSSNNTDVTLSPTTLTFTSSNWDTAQTVTVRAGQDADAANDSASVTHTVSGGGYGSVSASLVVVTVTAPSSPSVPPPPLNAAPEFTSVAEVSVAENQRAVLTVQAVDADEADSAVRYGLSGGADQARFALDPASGALTFIEWPDYENPADSGGDNQYIVTVRATSGADDRELSAEQTITVTVTDVEEVVLEPPPPLNAAPEFTSVAEVSVAENQRAVLTVQAVDADEADSAVRYGLSGGADQARFALDPASGALTFIEWPDYENPADSGGDNQYIVTVRATSGADDRELSAEQTITVTVTDVEEVVLEPPPPLNAAPEFTSVAEVSVAENQRAVLTVQAVDADEADSAVRYGLSGGADQARFALDPASGALTFIEWPDYENPADSGGDNQYIVTVRATSGADDRELSAEQTITVTVTDVEEVVLEPGAPVKENGVYQRGRSTIMVTDTASAEVSVTLPDALVDANGDALLQVTVTLTDAPSTPLPERTAFGFDEETRVDIEVSPVPVGGVELCLPVSAELRARFDGQPLAVLHFSDGTWRDLLSEDKEREGQVCASGVSEFSPFMAGFAVMTAAATSAVVGHWLARFGRTVMDQVIDAVSGRLAAPKSPGMEVSLAGRALPVWNRQGVADEYGSSEDAPASAATPGDAVAGGLRASLASPAERGASDALRSWISHTGVGDDDVPGGIPGAQSLAVQSWSPTARDLRSGTSFALTGEPGADGGMLSFWGRGSLNRFDGREDDLALDGEATTWLVGADRSRQSHTVGAMLGHSQVVGGYRSSADNGEAESGEIEATLTGVYPYTGLVVHERLSVWAVAGYGTGDLTLKPEGGGSVETGLSLTMAAAGVRSEALRAPEAGGLSLAVEGDVSVTRVSSDAAEDAVAGRLQAANVGVWRARAGVEGRRSFALDAKGGVVTPSFEVGARFDGGDAETGFGVDIGGGVALDDPGRGVTAALKTRGLVAHEEQGLREWGVSAAFAWDPRPQTEQGLSLSLMQSWGASSSGGMEALLSRDTLVGLAANDESPVGRRLEVELGYGLAVFGGDFTGAPNAGVALTESGRDWRLGWRLTPAWSDASGFEVNLDVVRNEVDGEAPEHAVTLRGGIRF